jgi:hypothetical protein
MARSEEVGRRVRLPRGAERPISIFINGVEQRDGADYEVRDNEIVFARPIVKEKLSRARWLVMFIGLFGSYGKNETIDIHYRHGDETRVLEDAPVLPDHPQG